MGCNTYSYATRSFLQFHTTRFSEPNSTGLTHINRNSLEHGISIALGGIEDVRVVQEILDTKHDLEARRTNRTVQESASWTEATLQMVKTYLLDGDSRLPRLLLIENGQADRARWVDVRVEERGREFACGAGEIVADQRAMIRLGVL